MAYDQLFEQAGRQFNVDPALLRAQMKIESGGNPNAKSEKGAVGLMQLIPETQKALGVTDPTDPKQSIYAAARLMAENLDRYGNVEDAVRAYHGGTDQSNWGPKTQAYANNVVASYTGKAAPSAAKAPDEEDFAALDFAAPKANAAPAPDDFAAIDFAEPKAAQAAQPVAAAIGSDVPVVAPQNQQAQPGPQDQSLLNPINAVQALGAQGIKNANFIGRGISDVLDAPSEWLASGAEKIGLTGLLSKAGINMPTGEQQLQMNKDSRAAYDAANPDPGIQGTLSRVGGNVLGTAGPIGMAGRGLAVGGNALLGAMRGTPALAGAAPAAQAVGNFVSGGGGTLSRMANLGTQGAAGAALLSGASDTPLTEQMGVGAALGAAIPAGAALLRGGKNAAQALTNPFTEAGRQRMAERLIGGEARAADSTIGQASAPAVTQSAPPIGPGFSPEDALSTASRGGRTAANFDEIIPGSKPTLAQATGNAGIAALERAAQSRAPNAFNELQQANNTARAEFFEGLRGNAQTLEQAVAQREETAIPLLKDALAGAGKADTAPVMSTIRGIMSSEAGQRDAVKAALKPVIDKLSIGQKFTSDPLIPGTKIPTGINGNGLQYDVNQLYGIRKSINDQLEKVSGRDNSVSQLASRELIQVRKSLDSAIEDAAPGFKDYLKQYATLSKPITSQGYLQNLDLMDQTSSQFSLNKVKAAVNKIEKMRKAPGANEAKDLSDDQLNGLKALHADLQREANSGKGMARGSNTFQNLATNQLIEAMGGGGVAGTVTPAAIGTGLGYLVGGGAGALLGGSVGGTIGNVAGAALRSKAPDVEAKLINLLLNPDGAKALKALEDPATKSMLNNILLQKGAVQGGASSISGGGTNKR